jgi:hypothetical protein
MASSTPRSSSAKKASPRKAAAKKGDNGASTSSAAQKKTSASTRRAASSADSSSDGGGARRKTAAKAEARPAVRASQVATRAASELLELTGKGAEGITGLERTDDGWTVQVEVVEVRRIPDTTDVLALYEVETDKQGALLGYRRLRRYARGTPGND